MDMLLTGEGYTKWPNWVNAKCHKNINPRKNLSGFKYERAEAADFDRTREVNKEDNGKPVSEA